MRKTAWTSIQRRASILRSSPQRALEPRETEGFGNERTLSELFSVRSQWPTGQRKLWKRQFSSKSKEVSGTHLVMPYLR